MEKDRTPLIDGPVSRRDLFRMGLKGSLKAGAVLSLASLDLSLRPLVGFAGQEFHGLSVFGDLKYGPDFKHFDYIQPDAPKGGNFSFFARSFSFNQNSQTFNTLNAYVLKGDSPARMELTFDKLMVRAFDEPTAVYGQLARSVELSPDGRDFTFHLRPEARFHDGSAVTAEDVAFSFLTLKEKGHPLLISLLRELEAVAVLAPDRVRLRYSGKQSRQAPIEAVSEVPIFSKAFYDGKDFAASSLTPPLGSGPYKVGAVKAGSSITFERDPDYWGKDLPVAVGHNNFDRIKLIFGRDLTILFEGFKKGVTVYHEEFISKNWAKGYDFPAIQDGRVRKVVLPNENEASAQGWFFNIRNPVLADKRTREAIALAFDFEWSNEKLFYGLYERTHSYFQRSAMEAKGAARGAVLDLLAPYQDQLDPAVFGEPYMPPKTNGRGKDRSILRKAAALLEQAGWMQGKTGLMKEDGTRLELEYLSNSPAMERIVGPWARNLRALGIRLTYRLVDPAQYESRLKRFDFDIVSRRFPFQPVLSHSVKDFVGSSAADIEGSRNLIGLKDPVLDAMVDVALNATNRPEMEAAGQAIDRILRAGHYWVPNWNKPAINFAVWRGYEWPAPTNLYDFYPERWWWFNPDASTSGKKS